MTLAQREAERSERSERATTGTKEGGRKGRKEMMSEGEGASGGGTRRIVPEETWRGRSRSAPGARQGAQEGSGTAGAVGTKHGRAMWCGPSWRTEVVPARFLPPSRESGRARVPPLPEASRRRPKRTAVLGLRVHVRIHRSELPKRVASDRGVPSSRGTSKIYSPLVHSSDGAHSGVPPPPPSPSPLLSHLFFPSLSVSLLFVTRTEW